MTSNLRAGTAKIDITPPLTIPYLGYVPRQALFQGIHDPLHARALVIDDGERQAALIAVDAIGFNSGILGPGRHFRRELGRTIEERANIPSEAVMLAASHAHSTPETLNITPLYEVAGAVEWLELLIGQLTAVVLQAREELQPARLKFGRGQAAGIAANRRQLLADGSFYQPASGSPPLPVVRPGLLDEEVGVLLVEFADHSYSLLANFACHPVSVQVQPLISADYPGMACSLVEKAAPGCRHCLFTQGADGDVNPRRGGARQDFGDVTRYGQLLGGEILAIAARLRAPEVEPMPPAIAAHLDPVALPIRPLPDPEPFRRRAAEAREAAARADDEDTRFTLLNQGRAADESLRTIALGAEPFRTGVQVIRLGEVALVGCPGELFVALGLEIKQQAAAPHTLVVGYANDYAGYLSTPAAFVEGGYETSLGPWCRIGPEGGRLVVDAGLRLVHQLWTP